MKSTRSKPLTKKNAQDNETLTKTKTVLEDRNLELETLHRAEKEGSRAIHKALTQENQALRKNFEKAMADISNARRHCGNLRPLETPRVRFTRLSKKTN